jgi:hypothetical protein
MSQSDIIGGFPVKSEFCAGCGCPLLRENAWMTDGCPCNSPLGVNSMNETRWRLLMELQQRQARAIERFPRTADGVPVIPGKDFVHHPVFGECWVDEFNQAHAKGCAFACLANEDGTRVTVDQCYSTPPEVGRCSCGAIFDTTDAAVEHECVYDTETTDSLTVELLSALKGVVAVADRKTDEFDRARSAIAKAEDLHV